MKASIYAGALLSLVVAGPSLATPPIVAAAGSEAIAGAVGTGGDATGTGTGGSVNNETGNSRALGVGLGQAPTAVSGRCGKGNKFGFGALEWTDFSSKCFQYELAIIAEQAGQYERANAWVRRADGLE